MVRPGLSLPVSLSLRVPTPGRDVAIQSFSILLLVSWEAPALVENAVRDRFPAFQELREVISAQSGLLQYR